MQKSPVRADFSGGSAGRAGRRGRLKGKRGRGTLIKEKPPSFGMSQRTGAVVIPMLENVQQVTIGPLTVRTMANGSVVDTDEYDSSSRSNDWGYNHETISRAAGECACDEDAEGFCQAHVTTLEGS